MRKRDRERNVEEEAVKTCLIIFTYKRGDKDVQTGQRQYLEKQEEVKETLQKLIAMKIISKKAKTKIDRSKMGTNSERHRD